MKRRLLCLTFSLAFLAASGTGRGASVAAQSPQRPEGPYVTLYGRAVDTRTGEAVPFASVRMQDSGTSNVTNAEGLFSLKVPADTPDDVLVSVRHLGYQSAERTVGALRKGTAERPLILSLVPVTLTLDPSVVRSVDPLVLLQTAYRRVPDNYPRQHEHLTTFYRELIRKGSKYLVLNEAIVDVDKAPYNSLASDRAAIYKGRGSLNFQRSDTLFVKFQGGIVGTLNGDVVKDPFVGVSLERVPQYYDLALEGSQLLDGHECLVLAFRQKKGTEEILFDGRLYIDCESYAIARVEYEMNVKGREAKAATRFVLHKPADWKIDVENARYTLDFKPFEGTWHFAYSRLELLFSARRRRSLWRHHYSIQSEMAVTDISTDPFTVPRDARVRFNDILSEKVSDFSDPAFWGSYNIIEPDQTIEAAIRRIIRQLESRERSKP